MSKPLLGIALGGGGARGAAHIGVLQEFDNVGLEIDMLSGVSAGAVIGALYAYSLDAKWVEDHFREIWSSASFNEMSSKTFLLNGASNSSASGIKKSLIDHVHALISLHRIALISNDQLREVLEMLVPVKTFEELKIPLKIVSTDIQRGEDVIIDKGDLIEALIKSCSIPGIMEPVKDRGRMIVDGGVSMPIPVIPLVESCDITVAVDIGVYLFEKLERPNARSIKIRSDIITSNRLKERLISDADLVIRPDTMGLHWSRFDSAEILLESGKNTAKGELSKIMVMLDNKKNKIESINNG